MTPIAPLPVAIPLAAAALLLMFAGILPTRLVRAIAVAASVTETVLGAVLVHRSRSGLIVYWFGGWIPRHGVAIGVSFAIDQLGAGAAALAGIVVCGAVLAGDRGPFEERPALTHALLMTMLAAMAGFCLTGDIFNLFVFYELIAVSAFGLAAIHTADVASLRGALNFAITNSIGAFLFLIGIALLYGRTGALNLAQIGRQLASARHVDGLVVVAITVITVGLLVKAAIVPFHFWLVDVASSGPLPLVLVLGGVLDTLAVYAIARIYWTAFAPELAAHDAALRITLVTLGAASALLCAVLALSAYGNRRRVAFVLVSHTGTLLVGAGCLTALGIEGAAIYAVAGGAIKAAVVACVGRLEHDSEGRAPGVVPIAVLCIAGLALAGLPLFGVSLGEAVIERAVSTAGSPWIAPVLFVTSVLTGAAILRIALAAVRTRGTRARGGPPAVMAGSFVAVAVAARFVLAGWVAVAASSFAASAAYGRAVLDGVRVPPAAPAAVVGLSARSDLLHTLGAASAIGLVAWLERLRSRSAASAEVLGGTTIGNAVRRLHEGRLGDSVAWLTVGATTVAVVLSLGLR